MQNYKPQTYTTAVVWIAVNDQPNSYAPVEVLMGTTTVLMIADMFGISPREVATDVYELRHEGEDSTLGQSFGKRQINNTRRLLAKMAFSKAKRQAKRA